MFFVLTEAGQKSRILQLGPTESDTINIWGKLPPFLHANRLGLPKAGAQVLARTTGGEPLLVAQDVGKGRVLACSGETWAEDQGHALAGWINVAAIPCGWRVGRSEERNAVRHLASMPWGQDQPEFVLRRLEFP
jgi:hypothetical protein